MKKIAIDTGPLYSQDKVRGIGVHTSELLKAIKLLKPQDLTCDPVNFQDADLSLFDLVHYQNFNPFLTSLPESKVSKALITIHDLIYLIYPEKYKPGIKGKINFLKQKKNLKNFDAVITISETSKTDINKFLGIDNKKIFVTHLAPRNLFIKLPKTHPVVREVKLRYKLPEKFVLYVGDVNYNKNIPTLVDACELAGVPLVIAGKHAKEINKNSVNNLKSLKGPRDYVRFLLGKPHPELSHYKKLLEKFQSKKVLRLGFIPDQDLVCLYNLATLYCQPSYYEGFGLPVLEAMKTGCPVLCSKTPALVEIARGAALFANSKNKNDLAAKIKNLLENNDLREDLIKKGFNKVKEFSWQKTARKTLEVYRQILK